MERCTDGVDAPDGIEVPKCGLSREPPAMPAGRCRMYGGGSTGPRTVGGLERIRKARTTHGREPPGDRDDQDVEGRGQAAAGGAEVMTNSGPDSPSSWTRSGCSRLEILVNADSDMKPRRFLMMARASSCCFR